MYQVLPKILITFGILLILIGLVLFLFDRVGFLGKLPGDIHIQKMNSEFHFPIVTCLVASIILSVLLSFFLHWFKK
ncbi:MAG: DUF2905 domain-containing protein [Candidatus Zixiibacteriota bacterium]